MAGELAAVAAAVEVVVAGDEQVRDGVLGAEGGGVLEERCEPLGVAVGEEAARAAVDEGRERDEREQREGRVAAEVLETDHGKADGNGKRDSLPEHSVVRAPAGPLAGDVAAR